MRANDVSIYITIDFRKMVTINLWQLMFYKWGLLVGFEFHYIFRRFTIRIQFFIKSPWMILQIMIKVHLTLPDLTLQIWNAPLNMLLSINWFRSLEFRFNIEELLSMFLHFDVVESGKLWLCEVNNFFGSSGVVIAVG